MVEVLEAWDFITIGIYFVIVLAVGLWASCRPNRDSPSGYFLAGKKMHWIPVGCSIFASNVGAPMFIGLAGAAAASGYSVTIFEWHGVFLLIALGWLFVPVYVSSGAFTMPEYLKRRFGGKRLRIYLSVLALVLYVLTKISLELYAGAIFVQQVIGWNIYISITAILIVTAVYTITGGLTAVMYTDTLQTVILLLGATILAIIGLIKIDGMVSLQERYLVAAANYTKENETFYACGMPRNDSFHIFRNVVTGDIPWTGSIFGVTIFATWVWCTDQLMVQRCLAARNYSYAKAGTLFAGILKLLPFFLWIIPGMIGRVLYPDEVACASPEKCHAVCGSEAGCSNIAYPLLVVRLLPQGLRGLMLAALLAALMSSLTSIFNSASTMFTMDLWKRWRPKASEPELMVVGRLAVVICIAFSIFWLPVLQSAQGGQLWLYLQAVTACIAPPWTVVFLLAIFWKRTTEQGAFWGLILGMLVGIPRLVLEVVYPPPLCGSGDVDTRPLILSKIHYSHFAIIISVICTIIIVVISLLTKPRTPKQLRKVTWWTRLDTEEPEVTDSEDDKEDVDETRSEEIEVDSLIKEENGIKPVLNHLGHSSYSSEASTMSTDISSKKVKTRKFKPTGREINQHRQGSYKSKIKDWLCGISSQQKPKLTATQRAAIRRKMTSLTENKVFRRTLDGIAIVAMLFTVFLFGMYC